MNRATRRRLDTRARRIMREDGCTCRRPALLYVDTEFVGETFVAEHEHDAACPVGDLGSRANELGIVPVLVNGRPMPRPCRRTNGGRSC